MPLAVLVIRNEGKTSSKHDPAIGLLHEANMGDSCRFWRTSAFTNTGRSIRLKTSDFKGSIRPEAFSRLTWNVLIGYRAALAVPQ